jgi:hypothetical protein
MLRRTVFAGTGLALAWALLRATACIDFSALSAGSQDGGGILDGSGGLDGDGALPGDASQCGDAGDAGVACGEAGPCACGRRCGSEIRSLWPDDPTDPKKAGWTFSGDAGFDPTNLSAVLIPALMTDQSGTLMYNNKIWIDGEGTTLISFRFRLNYMLQGDPANPADGFGFMFSTANEPGDGLSGGGLGMAGLGGYGVEFDLYRNPGCYDTVAPHIAFDTLEACPGVQTIDQVWTQDPDASLSQNYVDALWHTMTISHHDTYLVDISIDQVPLVSNEPLFPNGFQGYYILGFGAGDGQLTLRMEVGEIDIQFPYPRCL